MHECIFSLVTWDHCKKDHVLDPMPYEINQSFTVAARGNTIQPYVPYHKVESILLQLKAESGPFSPSKIVVRQFHIVSNRWIHIATFCKVYLHFKILIMH